MVDNIVLDTLTSPTLQKGASSPIISTKDGERDGTRGGGGGGGGSGELYDVSGLTYLGSFALRDGVNGRWARSEIGFRPPDGTNGTYGSVFSTSGLNYTPNEMAIAEYQIPDTLSLSMDKDALESAVKIKPDFLVRDTHVGNNPNGSDSIGYMRVIDGRFYISSYAKYDANGINTACFAMYANANDIVGSNGTGWITTNVEDFGTAYMNPVPSEYHASIGSWMIGSGNNDSIQSRWSQGPSINGFNPDTITNLTTSVTTSEILGYPFDPSFSDYSRPLSYGVFPSFPEARKSNDNYGMDNYNEKVIQWYLETQLGYNFSEENTTGNPDWFPAYEAYHASDPRIDWATLPTPPASINNNLWNSNSTVGTAFIIPGTKTFLAIGNMAGIRYGIGYKQRFLETGAYGGGNSPLSLDDRHAYYWAFNMDDILGARNIYDPKPYDYGVFDNNRWVLDTVPFEGSLAKQGSELGGFFDPGTNRIYVSRANYIQGQYWYGNVIVSVYQI